MILQEIFDSTYEYEVKLDHRGIYLVEFRDKDGRYIEVEFSKSKDQDIWLIEFTRDGSVVATGEGDAPKILSTVAAITQEFIDKKTPAFLVFSASKHDRARASVYRRMIMRKVLPYYVELKYPQYRFKVPFGETFDELWRLYRRSGGEDTTFMVIAHQDELKEALMTEVFDAKVEYEVTRQTAKHFQTKAEIGGRTIVFTALLDDGPNGAYWDVAFEEYDGHLGTFKATGKGKAFEVLSMVKASLTELRDRYQPEIVYFTADSTNGAARANIYRRMVGDVFNGYELEETKSEGDHVFIFRRP
jgi:hypothetical protein